jgi:putative Mn2+ efflux pump MntP
MKAALDSGNYARVNELMTQFKTAFGSNMDAVAASFGPGFNQMVSLIEAFRLGHLENGVDLYAVAVNIILDSYPTELVDQLKQVIGDDVMERLRAAYNLGRSVVDGQELRAIKAALDAQDLAEVQRLMTEFKSQYGGMAEVAQGFGAGYSQMVSLIEAYRLGHLEDGQDLYAIALEMMIQSYPQELVTVLKQTIGDDVLDRLRSAYALGRSVVSGDDLRELKASLDNGNMVRVNELMTQFKTAFGSRMDAVAASFGAGFTEMVHLIEAFRSGHLINGVDFFAQVVDNLIASYPIDLVDQLKAEIGDDVMTRLRTAYFAGRSVVQASDLEQLAAAISGGDNVAVNQIISALKVQFAQHTDAARAAFGPADFDRMEQMIEDYRLGN